MTNTAADLDTEVRRLRIRIIGLNPRHLAEAGERTPDRSRRDTITEALAEFSAIGSESRTVPDLGDQSLADQVVVLLEEGRLSAEELGESERDEQMTQLLDAAVRLRRNLA